MVEGSLDVPFMLMDWRLVLLDAVDTRIATVQSCQMVAHSNYVDAMDINICFLFYRVTSWFPWVFDVALSIH